MAVLRLLLGAEAGTCCAFTEHEVLGLVAHGRVSNILHFGQEENRI